MSKKIMGLAGAAAVLLTFGGVVHAEDFPATPVQAGPPRDLPGERLIPGLQEAVDLVNGATQPILQPILAPGGDAAAAPAPAARHLGRHHHHLAAHHHWRPHHVAKRSTHHKVG